MSIDLTDSGYSVWTSAGFQSVRQRECHAPWPWMGFSIRAWTPRLRPGRQCLGVLGRITKRGNRHLRTLFMQGARVIILRSNRPELLVGANPSTHVLDFNSSNLVAPLGVALNAR